MHDSTVTLSQLESHLWESANILRGPVDAAARRCHMKLTELQAQIALGEDSRRQFKRDVTNVDSLAAEMAAFANSEGGTIFLGVADDGSLGGLSRGDVKRLNQLIGNAASQHVRSPLTVQTENIGVGDDRVVIVLTIPKGQDKPYFDRNGVIWLKSGADKRRVNSKEELRRLFRLDQFHADELPTRRASTNWTSCAFGIFFAISTSWISRFSGGTTAPAEHGSGHRRRHAQSRGCTSVCRTAGVDQAAVRGEGHQLSGQ